MSKRELGQGGIRFDFHSLPRNLRANTGLLPDMTEHPTEPTNASSHRKYWILLMLIPVGLAVGVVSSLVSHLKQDEKANEVEHFSQELDLEKLTDSVNKITTYIGSRSLSSEPERLAMRQMTSFIQGELSPQNAGLEVHRDKGIPVEGRLWYHYWVNIEGKKSNQIHLVLTNYDGEKDTAESAKLSSLMSIAQSLGAETPAHSIRFVFAPRKLDLQEFIKQAHLRCLLPSENCIHTTVIETCQDIALDSPDGWFEHTSPLSLSATPFPTNISVLSHSTLKTGTQADIDSSRAAALLKASSLLRKKITSK